MGDRPQARQGRPWKPVRAESEQARELAGFLRAHIAASGMTLAELGRAIHRSKAQISHYVSGSLPPAELVDDLIRATVAEPRLQRHRLAEGRRLLHAALRPSLSIPAPGSGHRTEPAAPFAPGVTERLIDALERLVELERARSNDQMLIMVLLGMLARAHGPGQHLEPHALHPSPALADRRINPVAWWEQRTQHHRTHAVRSRLRHAGIHQFLDIGAGLPTADDTACEATAPTAVACRFVRAAHAPAVSAHHEALPSGSPADLINYVDADVHDPEKIMWGAAGTLDFSEPIAITMLDIVPLLRDTGVAVHSVHRLLTAMPPGSYLIFSRQATAFAVETVQGDTGHEAGETTLRDRDDLAQLLAQVSALESGGTAYSRWCPPAL